MIIVKPITGNKVPEAGVQKKEVLQIAELSHPLARGTA
jgi:hypothetical protein